MAKKKSSGKKADRSSASTMHERLALRRVREQAAQIELHGDEWAEEQRRAYRQGLVDAQFGRKMRRVSEVSDAKLLAAYERVRRDFPGELQKNYFYRVGIEVGRSPSRVQYRLGRLGKLRKK